MKSLTYSFKFNDDKESSVNRNQDISITILARLIQLMDDGYLKITKDGRPGLYRGSEYYEQPYRDRITYTLEDICVDCSDPQFFNWEGKDLSYDERKNLRFRFNMYNRFVHGHAFSDLMLHFWQYNITIYNKFISGELEVNLIEVRKDFCLQFWEYFFAIVSTIEFMRLHSFTKHEKKILEDARSRVV